MNLGEQKKKHSCMQFVDIDEQVNFVKRLRIYLHQIIFFSLCTQYICSVAKYLFYQNANNVHLKKSTFIKWFQFTYRSDPKVMFNMYKKPISSIRFILLKFKWSSQTFTVQFIYLFILFLFFCQTKCT